ncbi:MAG TPA: MMPL family transporter, partial [Planctomicrobium sp.]|nr:MMPL family transporter [Planctomicrobium sp.]
MSSAQGTERTPAHPESEGVLGRLLEALTLMAARRPGVTLTFVALMTLVSIGITGRFLTFKTNRADLIDPNQEFHHRWMQFVEKFGDDSDVVVVVEGENPDQIRPVLERIGKRLDGEHELFARVLYKVDPTALRHKALQYLAPQDLERAQSKLEMYAPILEGHWNRAGLESYCRRLTNHIQRLSERQSKAELSALLNQTQRLIGSLASFMQNPSGFTSPWPEVLSADDFPHMDVSEPQYQLTPNGKMGFVLALPRNVSTDFSGSSRSLARMNAIVTDARKEFADVKIGLTGIPVLEADEMQRSQIDMTAAAMISFVGVLMISLIGFRGIRHPMMSMSMIAVGTAWAMGFATIVVGHLNILSMTFVTILIGVGDYGTHYVASYLENRHKGLPLLDALGTTSRVVGPGIVTAAITTSLSFFAAAFTTFQGVAELGIIAGGGILLCGVATFCVLPPLIALLDRRLEPKQLPVPFQGHILRKVVKTFPGTVSIVGCVALVILTASIFKFEDGKFGFRIRYDYNLLNMQAKGVESVELQQKVFEEAGGSLLYAISMTDSAEKVRELKEK